MLIEPNPIAIFSTEENIYHALFSKEPEIISLIKEREQQKKIHYGMNYADAERIFSEFNKTKTLPVMIVVDAVNLLFQPAYDIVSLALDYYSTTTLNLIFYGDKEMGRNIYGSFGKDKKGFRKIEEATIEQIIYWLQTCSFGEKIKLIEHFE